MDATKQSATCVSPANCHESKVSKNCRAVWRWIERILFTSGLLLLAFWGAVRFEGCISAKVATETFFHQEALTQPASQNVEELSRPEETDFSNWAAGRVRAYKAVFSGKFGSPMAVLEIPRIPLAVPLLEGTDELTLNHAVGHIAGTARPGKPGNIGIAGHRDGFFRGLKNLKPGDAIELRTAHGTDTYEVGQIQIVTPDNVAVLRARPVSSLTLVTCYPFYFIGSAPKRFVVTAYLTKRNSAGSTTSETRKTTLTSSLTKEQQ